MYQVRTARSSGRAALVVCALVAAGGAQAQIIVRPQIIVPAPVYVAPQPVYVAPQPVYVAPQPVYVAPAPQPVYVQPTPEVGYVAGPLDLFIVNAAPADVVFIGGDTYIWAIDANGHRYRRFYAHGDHRADVFHRRDELHHVMERNGGRLPERGEARAGQPRGSEQPRRDVASERHAPANHPGENREEHR